MTVLLSLHLTQEVKVNNVRMRVKVDSGRAAKRDNRFPDTCLDSTGTPLQPNPDIYYPKSALICET